jgi:hypothetical protein
MTAVTDRNSQHPIIDKDTVEKALAECLTLAGLDPRPVRWFADARSARAYLEPYEPHKAYRSLGFSTSSPLLDDAWHAVEWADPDPRGVRPTGNGSRDPTFRFGEQLRRIYDEVVREDLPVRLVELLRKLEPNGSQFIAARLPCEIRAHSPMAAAFAAGLLGYRIGRAEVVCFPQPTLWTTGDRLHRADGPAVEWDTGERYFFYHGIQVPNWIFEHPERITIAAIHSERNLERRRCMIERFGPIRFLCLAGARLVDRDSSGTLWQVRFESEEATMMVEVENGTAEADGSRRRYYLQVPPWMQSVRQAVAWTYGLSPAQYQIALRT